MSAWSQLKIFIAEVKSTRAQEVEEETVDVEDLEFVSAASEARVLHVPEGASLLISVSFLLIIASIVWAAVSPLDEVVKAQGKVIPTSKIQVVQSLEGGIIKEIKIEEGQHVKKGQALLIISAVSAKSDLQDNEIQYNSMLAHLVALNTALKEQRILHFPAELQPFKEIMAHERSLFNAEWESFMQAIVEIEDATTQLKHAHDDAVSSSAILHSSYNLALQELKMNRPLLKSGAISRVAFLQIQQRVNDIKAKMLTAKIAIPKTAAAVNESEHKRARFIKDKINKVTRERNELDTKLNAMHTKGVSLQAKVDHTVVTSPVNGIINKLNYNTIGGVIRPGMDVLEVVPGDNKLLIEVQVKPKDIGFVHTGLKAKLKFTAFDFSTYGGLEGEVKFVSADTITDKKGKSFYLVRLLTETTRLSDKKGGELHIIPGMQSEADIIVNQHNVLHYIFKPMLK